MDVKLSATRPFAPANQQEGYYIALGVPVICIALLGKADSAKHGEIQEILLAMNRVIGAQSSMHAVSLG